MHKTRESLDRQQIAETENNLKVSKKHYDSADEPCPDCGLLKNENGWCDCYQGEQ